MKRIGLLCLAMVLALGTLGVGYALWWDEVTIEGTVDTGTVRIGIVKAEATLYQDKEVATVDIRFEGEIGPWDCPTPPGAEPFVYERLVVTIEDAFPCLTVDVEFYVGSRSTVPVHITGLNMYDPTGELVWVWTNLPGLPGNSVGYFYHAGDPDQQPVITFEIINLVSTQLHGCGSDKADLIFHVVQPAKQDHTYSFVFEVLGEQWAK